MTTTLQFSVYDMCHCYSNLNSTHTLNMIVYFCPFGLQSKLLQQTQMRWPSWFQDLESYQPMGGGLSLIQLTVVIWCSFARTKSTKLFHQTTCSTMRGVCNIDGYGCFMFKKDPSSVGPGVFNWRGVYSLDNHSMFLRLNYSIIQPIIDHITCDDYCAMWWPTSIGDLS